MLSCDDFLSASDYTRDAEDESAYCLRRRALVKLVVYMKGWFNIVLLFTKKYIHVQYSYNWLR